jgi:single-strand DNA-binding protein
MRGINKVIICGRLGHDPELRTTPKGASLCEIRLATNRPVREGDGWTEVADWHRVTLWSKAAESCQKLAKKGDVIAIEGELRTESWTDREGNKRSKVAVHSWRFDFVGRTRAGRSSGEEGRSPERAHPAFEHQAAASTPF